MQKYKVREISHNQIDVQANGWSFGVIFGTSVDGHYIAIPGWGICVPAGKASDSLYNSEKLARCKDKCVADSAAEIAAAIAEYLDD